MPQLLFHILRSALFGETISTENFKDLSDKDWQKLYSLSVKQGVLAIVYDVISKLPKELMPPRNLMIQWALSTENIENRYKKQKAVIEKLAALFAENEISTMLLKGLGLAQYYPIPEHRECGDIDIYLFGKQKKADEVVARELGIRVSTDVHHHTVFVCDGVMVENHFDFINIVAHKSNKNLERKLKAMSVDDCRAFAINNVCLPPVNLDAIYLMRHAALHFAATEINLRHLTDCLFFLKNNHIQIDFVELNKTFEELNMHRFANAINGILIDNFGLNAGIFPNLNRDKKLETRVLNDIISPEFDEKIKSKNIFSVILFKFRRFYKNRWKHKIVYSESVWCTFFQSTYAHLLKPKTIRKMNPASEQK